MALPPLKDVLLSVNYVLPTEGGQTQVNGHGGDTSVRGRPGGGLRNDGISQVHQHSSGGRSDSIQDGQDGNLVRRRRNEYDQVSDDWDSAPGTPQSTASSFMALSDGGEKVSLGGSTQGSTVGGTQSWENVSDGGSSSTWSELRGIRYSEQVGPAVAGKHVYDTIKRPRIEQFNLQTQGGGAGDGTGYPPRPPIMTLANQTRPTSHLTDEWRAVQKVGPKLGFDSLEEISVEDKRRASNFKAGRVLGVDNVLELQNQASSRRRWSTNSGAKGKGVKMLGVRDVAVLDRETSGLRRHKQNHLPDGLKGLVKAAQMVVRGGNGGGLETPSIFNSAAGSLESAHTQPTDTLSSVDNRSDRFSVNARTEHNGDGIGGGSQYREQMHLQDNVVDRRGAAEVGRGSRDGEWSHIQGRGPEEKSSMGQEYLRHVAMKSGDDMEVDTTPALAPAHHPTSFDGSTSPPPLVSAMGVVQDMHQAPTAFGPVASASSWSHGVNRRTGNRRSSPSVAVAESKGAEPTENEAMMEAIGPGHWRGAESQQRHAFLYPPSYMAPSVQMPSASAASTAAATVAPAITVHSAHSGPQEWPRHAELAGGTPKPLARQGVGMVPNHYSQHLAEAKQDIRHVRPGAREMSSSASYDAPQRGAEFKVLAPEAKPDGGSGCNDEDEENGPTPMDESGPMEDATSSSHNKDYQALYDLIPIINPADVDCNANGSGTMGGDAGVTKKEKNRKGSGAGGAGKQVRRRNTISARGAPPSQIPGQSQVQGTISSAPYVPAGAQSSAGGPPATPVGAGAQSAMSKKQQEVATRPREKGRFVTRPPAFLTYAEIKAKGSSAVPGASSESSKGAAMTVEDGEEDAESERPETPVLATGKDAGWPAAGGGKEGKETTSSTSGSLPAPSHESSSWHASSGAGMQSSPAEGSLGSGGGRSVGFGLGSQGGQCASSGGGPTPMRSRDTGKMWK
ncbi:unnamed protein product, partial [Choristocarpus tenellus]